MLFIKNIRSTFINQTYTQLVSVFEKDCFLCGFVLTVFCGLSLIYRTLCFNSPVVFLHLRGIFCVLSLEFKSWMDCLMCGCLCIIDLDH